MQPYGSYKIRYKVQGHGHECYDCVPGIHKKIGRAKARFNAKKSLRKYMRVLS